MGDQDRRRSMGVSRQLPSRGILYEGKIPDGNVTLLPWSLDDVKMLASPRVDRTEILDKIIASCWDQPTMPTQQLLTGDRMFILIATRHITLGNIYPVRIQCRSCRQTFVHNVDLASGLTVRVLEPEKDGPTFEIKLPISGMVMTMRRLTGADEMEIMRYARANRLKTQGALDQEDPAFTYTLSRYIVAIDGKKVQPHEAYVWLEENRPMMHAADAYAIIDGIEQNDCGVDLWVNAPCPVCSFESSIMMPLDPNFFRPDTGRRGAW